jgi:hypothetical protein
MDELAEKVSRFGKVIRADLKRMTTSDALTALNWQPRRIAKQWKSLAPDVIHLNSKPRNGLIFCERPGAASRRVHSPANRPYPGRTAVAARLIARCALGNYNGILVAVQETRRRLEEFSRRHKHTETIFNGVPLVDQEQDPPCAQ